MRASNCILRNNLWYFPVITFLVGGASNCSNKDILHLCHALISLFFLPYVKSVNSISFPFQVSCFCGSLKTQ